MKGKEREQQPLYDSTGTAWRFQYVAHALRSSREGLKLSAAAQHAGQILLRLSLDRVDTSTECWEVSISRRVCGAVPPQDRLGHDYRKSCTTVIRPLLMNTPHPTCVDEPTRS
jgi:hypothetical protein